MRTPSMNQAQVEHSTTTSRTYPSNAVGDRVMSYESDRFGRNSAPDTGRFWARPDSRHAVVYR